MLALVEDDDEPSNCVGMINTASATNVSEPAVNPTQGAQRHSKNSLIIAGIRTIGILVVGSSGTRFGGKAYT